MGSLAPVLASPLFAQGVSLAASEFGRQKSRVSRNQGLEQARATQLLQQRQAAQNANLERDKIKLNAANAEKDRKSALRRAVSRQRASFGSQGIGSKSGSSQAVLLGLFEESDGEKKKREGLDNLRFNALDNNLAQKNSLNVLQRSQLKERNKLSTLTGFGDTLTGLASFTGGAL